MSNKADQRRSAYGLVMDSILSTIQEIKGKDKDGMIREKKTKSGPLLEADFYPVWRNGVRVPTRAPKTKPSTQEQIKYNQRQAEKKLIRLVNANFDSSDLILHPTYIPENAPQDEKQARRDMVNYIRRLKTRRKSALKEVIQALEAMPELEALKGQREKLEEQKRKLEQPLKYIYVMERVEYKSGKYKGRANWHFHAFFTGGLSRREMEQLWPKGMRTNADRFQPDRFGPVAAARYLSKGPQGSKRYTCSRNLDKPVVAKPKDGKITEKGVQRIATQRVDDKDYWERRYKGYRFIRCYSRYNEYNGYWYVSVVMYKVKDGQEPPDWNVEEWIDD